MLDKIECTCKKVKFWLFMFMFLMIFSALIVAQEPIVSGEKYLQRFSLCADISENNPLLEKNFFSTRNEKVIAWFQFSYNADENFMLYWEWISPEGKLYHRGEVEMKAGNYQNYRTWYWIGVKEHYSSKFPGEWRVKIYINNIFLSEKNFFIINSN